MKSIFFTGKGGTGKSTISAASALQLSEKGYRVLAVSLDPAHNLGDIFGIKLSHKKKKYNANLFLQEVDLEKAADEYVQSNVRLMKDMYGYLKAFNMDSYFDVLKYSPGIEEYAALTALEKILSAESEMFDYIVFDTPPTGLTLRIFALPGITLLWLDRLVRIRKSILSKRYTIHNIRGKYAPEGVALSYDETEDRVMIKLNDLKVRYKRVLDMLQGEQNRVAVVFNPDFLSLKESDRLISGLMELKMPVSDLFDNKVDAGEPDRVEAAEKVLAGKYPFLRIQRIFFDKDHIKAGFMPEDDMVQSFTANKE